MKNIDKAYVISHSWGVCDDDSIDCVMLDKEKAQEYVDKMNEPRRVAKKLYEKCCECRNDEYDCEVQGQYKLKESCELCKMNKDRYGEYCENDKSDYYQALSGTDLWFMEEVELK